MQSCQICLDFTFKVENYFRSPKPKIRTTLIRANLNLNVSKLQRREWVTVLVLLAKSTPTNRTETEIPVQGHFVWWRASRKQLGSPWHWMGGVMELKFPRVPWGRVNRVPPIQPPATVANGGGVEHGHWGGRLGWGH